MRDVLSVFERIHRRREGEALEPLDIYSKASHPLSLASLLLASSWFTGLLLACVAA